MMWLINLIFRNRYAQWIGLAFLALAGIKARDKIRDHKAVKGERTKQEAADNDKANDIRRRVDVAKQLHAKPDTIYRD